MAILEEVEGSSYEMGQILEAQRLSNVLCALNLIFGELLILH